MNATNRLLALHLVHCPLRYYRLTESMAAQDGNTGDRSREASEAFKMVSTMWVVVRKKVGCTAGRHGQLPWVQCAGVALAAFGCRGAQREKVSRPLCSPI